MAKWTAFPYDSTEYRHDAASLKKHWARLHTGDAEPLPKDAAVLAAWALFHAGDFQKAFEAGLKAGAAGIVVANKAQCIYANYLEPSREDQAGDVCSRPPNGRRRSRPTSPRTPTPITGRRTRWAATARASAWGEGLRLQGLGSKVKSALETTIKLAPKHADAHIALGSFHAEVMDEVGKLLGRTQGADTATGLKMYKDALKLNPGSAIAMIEYANGMVMLEGDKKMKDAEKLYADAAACTALDAMERLDVEMAKSELED